MASLIEMASNIVSAHASTSALTKEDLVNELQDVYKALSALEKGEAVSTEETSSEEDQGPAVSRRKAFGKTQVYCMVCGRGGMKTLARHLKTAHDMKPGEYRRKFGIPSTQSLAAKDYSESRRQMAIEKDLGAGLAKARAARKEKKKSE